MDEINIKLIEKMQENADLSLLELSKSVGISKTACWNRLQRMEVKNIILGKKIIFNRNAINLPIVVFLSISVGRHSLDWVEEFSEIISLSSIATGASLTAVTSTVKVPVAVSVPSETVYVIISDPLKLSAGV